MKDKKHMIMSGDSGKAFNKIEDTYTIKTQNKARIRRKHLSMINTVLDNPTANIILNKEKLKTFSLK